MVTMPEGPEVELSARQVNKILAGKKLTKIALVDGPYLKSPKPKYSTTREQILKFKPHRITQVYAKGKLMIFELDGPQYSAFTSHFGMAGQWCWSPKEHHLLTLEVEGTLESIYLCDQRRFSTIGLLTKEELDQKLKGLGLQVLSPFTFSDFLFYINRRPKKELCEILLEQKIFCGIGNYLRADILYVARLHPLRVVSSLDTIEKRRLCQAIRTVCQESLESSATVCGNYSDPIVEGGGYKCKIYGREEDDEGRKVEKLKVKSRMVHWCPEIIE